MNSFQQTDVVALLVELEKAHLITPERIGGNSFVDQPHEYETSPLSRALGEAIANTSTVFHLQLLVHTPTNSETAEDYTIEFEIVHRHPGSGVVLSFI